METDSAALPPDGLQQVLTAGIRAPSAENKHYLRFERGPVGVWLTATDQASWGVLPHRKWLALLSYGAVVENMALRAMTLGYEQRVRWQPEPGRPERIAQIGWARSGAPPDPLAQAIDARHTNRRFYRRQKLEAGKLERLSEAVASVPRTQLLWCDAKPARTSALRAIRMAEAERFQRRELHAELFSAVRFECGWQATAEQGLPPGALQVEPPMRPLFAALRHWPVMRAASFAGAHVALGLRAAYLPCALAPHLGVLLAEGATDDESDLRAGRALQRAWLAATAQGLAFQPFAAPGALSRQRPGSGWVRAATQARLEQLLDEVRLGHSGHTSMFFRLGRAEAPATVSARLPLDRYWS